MALILPDVPQNKDKIKIPAAHMVAQRGDAAGDGVPPRRRRSPVSHRTHYPLNNDDSNDCQAEVNGHRLQAN